MISQKLMDAIEAEGRKKGFQVISAGGEYDNKGEFIFVIKLKRHGLAVSKTRSAWKFWKKADR